MEPTEFDFTPKLKRDACNARLRKQFADFHERNPWVYRRLLEMCISLKQRGFRRYSMRTLISVLRFEWDLRTDGDYVSVDGGVAKKVKLNNNHSPYYARLVLQEHPGEFDGFFEMRRAEGEGDDEEAED